MDSKLINKLIRSEIWPILRTGGFDKFDSRTAWRYQSPFICVVNFQSFNLSLAQSLGCTTYSFAVRLGIYVEQSDGEKWVRRDAADKLRPRECECEIRAHLNKRTTVDGFPREDIFYIDPDGFSAAAVFHEVKDLIASLALPWFTALTDVDGLIRWLSTKQRPEGLLDIYPGFIADMEYPAWTGLLARLLLWKHAQSPSSETASLCRQYIGRLVSERMDTLLPFHDDTHSLERAVRYIRSLFDCIPGALPPHSALSSSAWISLQRSSLVSFHPPLERDVRRAIWQCLKAHGFSEFSNRLAHRLTESTVQAVAITYPTPLERRQRGFTSGLFRLGLGIFWHDLAEELIPIRTNRDGAPRPKLMECHLGFWLTSRREPPDPSPLLFSSIEEALVFIEKDGLSWLSLGDDMEASERMLEQPDWKIFAQYPTMIGLGSANSVWRWMIRALHAKRRGDTTSVLRFLQLAKDAVHSHYAPQRPRMQRWISLASPRLTNSGTADPRHPPALPSS